MRSLLAALLCLPLICGAKQHRSHAAKAAFQREHPCPSTGKRRGSCPGWILDHRIALCAGGSDTPDNLQWQSIADAKAKDKLEWKECRAMHSK